MSDIFVSRDDHIDVYVYIGSDENGKTRYWNTPSDMPEGATEGRKYTVSFRRPNFRDSTQLLDLGMKMNLEGGMDLALNEIRLRRMQYLLVDWDLENKGKKVPASPEAIAELHPTFAMVLSGGLEKALGIEEGLFEDDETDNETTDEKASEDNPGTPA